MCKGPLEIGWPMASIGSGRRLMLRRSEQVSHLPIPYRIEEEEIRRGRGQPLPTFSTHMLMHNLSPPLSHTHTRLGKKGR